MIEKYKVVEGFDDKNKPCQLIEYIDTKERYSTENILEANSLCTLLNEQEYKILEQKTQLDFLTTENQHMKKVLKQNRKLKQKIHDLENINYTWKDIIETIEEKQKYGDENE